MSTTWNACLTCQIPLGDISAYFWAVTDASDPETAAAQIEAEISVSGSGFEYRGSPVLHLDRPLYEASFSVTVEPVADVQLPDSAPAQLESKLEQARDALAVANAMLAAEPDDLHPDHRGIFEQLRGDAAAISCRVRSIARRIESAASDGKVERTVGLLEHLSLLQLDEETLDRLRAALDTEDAYALEE